MWTTRKGSSDKSIPRLPEVTRVKVNEEERQTCNASLLTVQTITISTFPSSASVHKEERKSRGKYHKSRHVPDQAIIRAPISMECT